MGNLTVKQDEGTYMHLVYSETGSFAGSISTSCLGDGKLFNPLINKKAAIINPFHGNSYDVPVYIKPGTNFSVAIESREMEISILAAYDYGIDSLSEDGLEQLDRLIADLKVAITGR